MFMKPQDLKPFPSYYFSPEFRGAPLTPTEMGMKIYKSRKMEGTLGGFFNILLAGERASGTALYAARKAIGFSEIDWIEQSEPGEYGYRRISPSEAIGLKGYDDRFWTARGIASLALDIVLDPTTYIGIGLAGKTAKLGGLVIKGGGIRVGAKGVEFLAETQARGISRATAERKLFEYMGRDPKIQEEMMERGGAQAVKFMGQSLMETARVTEPAGRVWRATPMLDTRTAVMENLRNKFVLYHKLKQQVGEWAAKLYEEYYRKTGVHRVKWDRYVARIAEDIPEEWHVPIVRYVELGELPTENIADITRLGELYRSETSIMAKREVAGGILEKESIRPRYYARVPTEEAMRYVEKTRGKEFGEGLTREETVSKYIRSLSAAKERTFQEDIFFAEEAMRKATGVEQWYVFDPFESLQRRGVSSIMSLESRSLWDTIVSQMGIPAIAKTKAKFGKEQREGEIWDLTKIIAEEERSKSAKIGLLYGRAEEQRSLVEIARENLVTHPDFIEPAFVPRYTKGAVTAKETVDRLMKERGEYVGKHPAAARKPIEYYAEIEAYRLKYRAREESMLRDVYRHGPSDIETAIDKAKSEYAEFIKSDYAKRQQEYIDSMRAVGEFSNVLEDLRLGLPTILPSKVAIPPGTFTPKQLEKYIEIRNRVGMIDPRVLSPAEDIKSLTVATDVGERLLSDVSGILPDVASRDVVLKAARESDIAGQMGMTKFVERIVSQSKKKEYLFYEAERKLKYAEASDIAVIELPKRARNKIERLEKEIAARGTESDYVARELAAFDIKEAKYYTARRKSAESEHLKYRSLSRQIETARKHLFEGTLQKVSPEEFLASARKKHAATIKPLEKALEKESTAFRKLADKQARAEFELYEWERRVPIREEAMRKELSAKVLLPLKDYTEVGGITYKLEKGQYVPTEAIAEYKRRIPTTGWWSRQETKFKKTLTSIWAAFHARNLYGILGWQNILAEVGARGYLTNIDVMRKTSPWMEKHAAWAMGDVGKLYDVPFKGKKTAAQMRDMAEEWEAYGITGMVDVSATYTAKRAGIKNWIERKYEQYPQEAMVGIESIGRGALFWDRVMKGVPVEKAAKDVEKFHFRYGQGGMTEFESDKMRHIFLFYRWMRGNIPLQAQMSLEKPGTFAGLAKVYERSMSPEARERLKPWQQERFGFNVGKTFVTLDLPFYEHPLMYFDPRQWGNIGFALSPAIKYPVGMVMGRDPATGVPITDWKERGEFTTAQFSGRFMYAGKEISKTWTGERPASWTAIHQLAGMGVYEMPPVPMYAGMTTMPRVPSDLKKLGITQDVWTEWKLAHGWTPRLTDESRMDIFQQHGGRCSVCGQPCSPSHPCREQLIVPVELGGKNVPENTILLHDACSGAFRRNIAPLMAAQQEHLEVPKEYTFADKNKLFAVMDDWNDRNMRNLDLVD